MSRTLIFTLLGLCLLQSDGIIGQEIIDADRFFLDLFEKSPETAFTGSPVFRSPWLEELEFRTETRDLDPERQEYTLRLSPSTPGLRKAQREFANQISTAPDLVSEEYRCEEISSRYDAWLDLYLLESEKTTLRDLLAVYTDKQTLYERMMNSLDFSWGKIFRNKTDISDLQIRLGELALRQERILREMDMDDAGVVFDFSTFISDEMLNRRMEDIVPVSGVDAEEQYEMALIDRELAVELAEKRQYFDFAQFRYQGPHDNPFEERFSVGLGFQLPSGGNRKLKMLELTTKRSSLERESSLKMKDREEKLREIYLRFRYFRAAFDMTRAVVEQEGQDLQKIVDGVRGQETYNPELLLEIRERQLLNDLRLFEYRAAMLDSYLDGLGDAGQLCTLRDGSWLRN